VRRRRRRRRRRCGHAAPVARRTDRRGGVRVPDRGSRQGRRARGGGVGVPPAGDGGRAQPVPHRRRRGAPPAPGRAAPGRRGGDRRRRLRRRRRGRLARGGRRRGHEVRSVAARLTLLALLAASVARGESRPGYGGKLVGSLLSQPTTPNAPNAPTTIDPLLAASYAELTLVGLVFDGLYRVDAAGRVVPHLAEAMPTTARLE